MGKTVVKFYEVFKQDGDFKDLEAAGLHSMFLASVRECSHIEDDYFFPIDQEDVEESKPSDAEKQ